MRTRLHNWEEQIRACVDNIKEKIVYGSALEERPKFARVKQTSMHKAQTNYAFIDGQNLHLSIKALGWILDYRRFRIYLKEKYVEKRQRLYTALQRMGYICVFKPTLTHKDGSIKGNCDAELVLHAMIEYENYAQAIVVSGDGDFYCLIDHLIRKQKMAKLLVPNQKRYSALLKAFPSQYLAFVSDLRTTLERKEPRKDGTSKGAFHRDTELL